MGDVDDDAYEGQSSDEVAEDCWDFVPQQIVDDGEVSAKHQPDGEQEHVDHGVLETEVEEDQDRHPHGNHLAGQAIREHGTDCGGGYHPVAHHAPDEQRQHARGAIGRVTNCPILADFLQSLTDSSRVGREGVGQVDGHE
ncbi:Uncharacterised protein [Mycobacteroides abscessus subsp. abscessus]|nr:Uncharacterised protein [Mycobacteroides abscessus subsp. abscessus]